jgi:nicotinamidase-related amidase
MVGTVLLILDAQVNMFDEAQPVYNAARLLGTLQGLIAAAHANGVPVIFVQNEGGPGDPDEPGTPGWRIHPAVAPATGDVVLGKRHPDAFEQTDLKQELDGRRITRLVITGMQTELCIAATTQQAKALGYEVVLVEDGHSTFNDGTLTADQIIQRQNRAMNELVAVKPASQVRFERG